MSFINVAPDLMSTAATDLANIGSTITEAHTAAALPTTTLAAAGGDEISAAVASLFSTHGQVYHQIGAEAASFHQQFV